MTVFPHRQGLSNSWTAHGRLSIHVLLMSSSLFPKQSLLRKIATNSIQSLRVCMPNATRLPLQGNHTSRHSHDKTLENKCIRHQLVHVPLFFLVSWAACFTYEHGMATEMPFPPFRICNCYQDPAILRSESFGMSIDVFGVERGRTACTGVVH